MLTRLQVTGFKNLVDVDVRFGPFTCIAGANAVGKSNLFDAIRFLSALADRPLLEAALEVRAEGMRVSDLRAVFHRVGEHRAREMRFVAEMVIPPRALDDFNQPAEASITFLEYTLALRLEEDTSAPTRARLVVSEEGLVHVNQGDAPRRLAFPHSAAWRKSVIRGRRTSPFISTESEDGGTHVKLHQEGNAGRPRRFLAETLPRTVLSSANAAESPTALVVRREMASWRQLQLEPTAMRAPDEFTAPSRISASGGHMPATLARLGELHRPEPERTAHGRVCARVANRLAELTEGVREVAVEVDRTRERYTLQVIDREGTAHEARSLSDGTLRFLSLAILENDPEERGVLCFEEPENGIHPDRIEAMLGLLRDLAVDTSEEVDENNPLRQVIVNTHSPAVVQLVDEDHLVLAVPTPKRHGEQRFTAVAFRPLSDTWRARADEHTQALASGHVLRYLFPLDARRRSRDVGTRRVMDRPEAQLALPLEQPTE